MDVDDERIGAWRSLLLTHAAAVRAIEGALHDAGQVPLTWYDVLLELSAAPGRRLRMQDLSDRVVLSRTRVSRVVDELARAGLVERRGDPTDRRVAYATLTPAGRRRLRAAAPVYLAAIERHFTSHLDRDEQRTLRRLLDTVRAGDSRRPAVSRSR
jgi:DNA-binding MarR family transcriptional regulator